MTSYADDCALMAHTLTKAQSLFHCFRTAASRFGLTIALKKTEVMLQAVNKLNSNPLLVTAGDTVLTAVDKFCYLCRILTADATAVSDVSACIAKASVAFGQLFKRIWDEHAIWLDIKVAVYKAVILTVLLYGSKSWISRLPNLICFLFYFFNSVPCALYLLYCTCQMAG